MFDKKSFLSVVTDDDSRTLIEKTDAFRTCHDHLVYRGNLIGVMSHLVGPRCRFQSSPVNTVN